jgi:hypothetical protein
VQQGKNVRFEFFDLNYDKCIIISKNLVRKIKILYEKKLISTVKNIQEVSDFSLPCNGSAL